MSLNYKNEMKSKTQILMEALDKSIVSFLSEKTFFSNDKQSNQNINRYISTKKDTQTHPSKDRRIAAVKQSWYKASELRYQSAVPPPPVDEPYYYWGDDISLDKESFYDSTIAAWSGGLSDTTENISKNVEGIILDIVPLNDGTNGKTVKVLITNVDSAHNNLCLYKNKTIDMWVQFFGIAYEKDQFKIFLKPGRRFTFSVVDLHYAYYYLVGVGKQ